MSNLLFLLATWFVGISSLQSVPHAQLEEAFKRNSAEGIVALANEKVLVNIFGKEGVYSHAQATLVLKDFFAKKSKGDFSFIFKGKEGGGGTFSIANYVCQGVTHRVTFHFKKEGANYRIETLTIE